MHFVKKVEHDLSDVRSRSYYIYRCSCCNEEKIFWWVQNFDTQRLRECPKCKVLDDTNNFEFLIKQKQSLEQQLQAITIQLQTCNMKLASLQEATEQKETVHAN